MLKSLYIKFFLSIFLLITAVVYPDQPEKSLQERMTENRELLITEPDRAFSEMELLLEEAISTNDYSNELILLSRICWYYNYSTDINSLIHAAQLMEKKAIKYKDKRFEATAHIYLSSAYAANNLYEKAIAEFDKALAILEKEDSKDTNIILAKANAYTHLANMYLSREEPEKALKNLFFASKEYEKLEGTEQKKEAQYEHYSFMAWCYLEIDLDSTEHYVKKSMNLEPVYSPNINITFLNYFLLGSIYKSRRNYHQALEYYHKAEALMPENSNSINRGLLFKGLQEVYQALSDTLNSNRYEMKTKGIDLEISHSKYKSMHKILEDNPGSDRNKIYYIISIIGLILICSITVIFIFRLKKKNKLLQEQEKKSQEYLEGQNTQTKSNSKEKYKELIEMVKNNDTLFLTLFLKTFPDFSEKLQAINPRIVQTEIEFSALLKLNIPTKEIAQYKNIEPRTVQNKKYLIRKKLNIPKDMDIYFWFSKL